MRRHSTEYVILGLLAIEPNLSGYDMRKAIGSSVGYFWNESYGQIYPTLKRLASARLIRPGRGAGRGRKSRQTYVITKAGRARLRKWLALPFHNDPPRNEFLLKLFFGRDAAPGVSLAHVRDLQGRNQRALAMLEEIERSASAGEPPDPHFPYWMLTLRLGKAMTIAALKWGEKAQKELIRLEGGERRQSRVTRKGQKKTAGRRHGKGQPGRRKKRGE